VKAQADAAAVLAELRLALLGATGVASWAAATPKRVTPMTAEIIDGGEYSLSGGEKAAN